MQEVKMFNHYSDVIMDWWHLKSPATRLFTQPFVQVEIKENIKAPRHWPLWGESPVAGKFSAQWASNAEKVYIRWRQTAKLI